MPTPQEQFALDHPFAPVGWAPTARGVRPPGATQVDGRVLDLETKNKQLEGRVAQLERMIKGASISAECNDDGTITVTLTWGGG